MKNATSNLLRSLLMGLLLAALLPTLLRAQQLPAPTWETAWSGGGAGAVQASATAADAGGNILVAGSFAGVNVPFGAFALSNTPAPATTARANTSGFLVKCNAAGAVLWARQGSSAGSSSFVTVTTDAAGNVYATGYFEGAPLSLGNVSLPLATGTGRQDFVVKYDPTGTVQWARLIASSLQAYTQGIATGPGGAVYVAGGFEGALSVGSLPVLTNPAANRTHFLDFDAFLLKLDAQGTPQWVRQIASTNDDEGTGVAVDAAGNPALAGFFRSPTLTIGSTVLTNAGPLNTYDIFLAKYDAQGTPQWALRAGGTGPDYCQALTSTANGNLYLIGELSGAGGTAGGVTFGPVSGGSSGALIAAYSPQGAGLWARREGTGSRYTSIAPDASNNLVVSGDFYGTITVGTQTLTALGNSDILTARYAANGSSMGAGREGGYGSDYATGTCSDPGNGQVVVGSTTEAYFKAGGSLQLLPTEGTLDALLLRYAPGGGMTLAKVLGSGGGRDGLNGLAVDKQGNSYVSGFFANNTRLGTTTLLSTGFASFLAKYTPAGAILWAQQLPASVRSIALDGAGSLYVAGTFGGTLTIGSTTLSGAGGRIFLLKYDPQGTLLWARSAGSTNLDSFGALAVNAAGTVVLTGTFGGPTATFGNQTITRAGQRVNVFLARYDAAGTAQWARGFAGSDNTSIEVIGAAVDAQGSPAFTGLFVGPSVTFGPSTLNSTAMSLTTAFVVKCDPAGTVQWARAAQLATNNNYSFSAAVAFDASGNLAWTGGISGPTTFGTPAVLTPSPAGSLTQFLTKYDAAGALQWARQASASVATYGTVLRSDEKGNFYVGGTYSGGPAVFGATTLPEPAFASPYIVRYDAQGTPQWAVTSDSQYGYYGASTVNGLALGPNGSLSVAGTYPGYQQFSPMVSVSASEYVGPDFFVARLAGATPLAARTALAATSDLFPNPAHEAATWRLAAPLVQAETLRIFDQLGREVRRQPVPAQTRQLSLHLTGLPTGLYVLRCGSQSRRLVVE